MSHVCHFFHRLSPCLPMGLPISLHCPPPASSKSGTVLCSQLSPMPGHLSSLITVCSGTCHPLTLKCASDFPSAHHQLLPHLVWAYDLSQSLLLLQPGVSGASILCKGKYTHLSRPHQRFLGDHICLPPLDSSHGADEDGSPQSPAASYCPLLPPSSPINAVLFSCPDLGHRLPCTVLLTEGPVWASQKHPSHLFNGWRTLGLPVDSSVVGTACSALTPGHTTPLPHGSSSSSLS